MSAKTILVHKGNMEQNVLLSDLKNWEKRSWSIGKREEIQKAAEVKKKRSIFRR